MLLPKIHYDLTQIVVACGLYSNLCCSGTIQLAVLKMLLCVNSTYFCLINCGSKMLPYTVLKVRIQWQRQAFFPLTLFGHVVPLIVLPEDCWYNFILYNPNILLHCKLLDTKKFARSIYLCNKYFSELSLKITHNNSHNNCFNTNQIKTVCSIIITRPYGN